MGKITMEFLDFYIKVAWEYIENHFASLKKTILNKQLGNYPVMHTYVTVP